MDPNAFKSADDVSPPKKNPFGLPIEKKKSLFGDVNKPKSDEAGQDTQPKKLFGNLSNTANKTESTPESKDKPNLS